MYVLIEDSEFVDSTSHGVHHTQNVPLVMRRVVIRGAQGCALMTGPSEPQSKPKGIHIDIPDDVDRVALANLLNALISTNDPDKRQALVEPKNPLFSALKSGDIALGLAEKVLNLANHPAVSTIISSLPKF